MLFLALRFIFMTIKKRVLSFDFDGCLFNINYISADNKDVIKYNLEFLEKLKAENLGFDQIITTIGSNRQSKTLDETNRYGFGPQGLCDKGSCFPAIQVVNDYLGAIFDPLLLADIFADLSDGESYRRACSPDYQGVHSETYFDESKLTLLYAQIQKAAMEDPTAEIIYDFYDDRGDILYGLNRCFTKYPELIPKNVTIRLNQYNGKNEEGLISKVLFDIKGTGFIDTNYRQTVKDMITYSFEQYLRTPSFMRKVEVASIIVPAVLTNRTPPKEFPILSPLDSSVEETMVLEIVCDAPVKQGVFASDSINPFFATPMVPSSTGISVTTEAGIELVPSTTEAEPAAIKGVELFKDEHRSIVGA